MESCLLTRAESCRRKGRIRFANNDRCGRVFISDAAERVEHEAKARHLAIHEAIC